jgi:hypothetical protein
MLLNMKLETGSISEIISASPNNNLLLALQPTATMQVRHKINKHTAAVAAAVGLLL